MNEKLASRFKEDFNSTKAASYSVTFDIGDYIGTLTLPYEVIEENYDNLEDCISEYLSPE